MRKARTNAADVREAGDVFMYRDSSIAPLLVLWRRIKAVMDVLDSMTRSGGSLARSAELTVQWDCILRTGLVSLITLDDLQLVRSGGIGEFRRVVGDLHCRLTDFVHKVVVHCRDEALRGWRNWLRGDPPIHPYEWLRPDMVPPAPFLQCEPHVTPGGSGDLADHHPGLMRISERLDVALGKGQPVLRNSLRRWLPLLPVISLPELTGEMLADVLPRTGATAGSFDGWGWREMKVLPLVWFDELAHILSKVEEVGVWPDGSLDASIALIPKADGDDTPVGQRPSSVLPVVCRILTSARMVQLGDGFGIQCWWWSEFS